MCSVVFLSGSGRRSSVEGTVPSDEDLVTLSHLKVAAKHPGVRGRGPFPIVPHCVSMGREA